KFYFIDKPDRTQTQMYGGQIGILMTDKDYFPLYLANYAFGGPLFTTKMMEEIRVKRGWSYGANSFFRMGKQPRSWQFNLYPKIKDAPDALIYTLNMIRDFREKGLTPEEFERAQKNIINNSGFMFNTPQKRVENLLLEKTLDLPSGFMTRYREEVSKLTLNQVNQAIKNFLKPDQLVVTVLGTAKDLKEPIVKALGISENEMQVIPYTQE
ncbi:MAG: insulinase family protein, partial [Deltaproteobacteria bacterium]|nr:insulinase family protein [Deltaproteobacteria bacterium]